MVNHPLYTLNYAKWAMYRLCYEGGFEYKVRVLIKQEKESDPEYYQRIAMTPDNNFSSLAINRYATTLQQRLTTATRTDTVETFNQAARGYNGGVDLLGADVNRFIGDYVATELFITGKVGVVVDNYGDLGVTAADKGTKHPFFIIYSAENILNWHFDSTSKQYTVVLLRETVDVLDEDGLVVGQKTQIRKYVKNLTNVTVIFQDENGSETKRVVLDVPKIPFHVFELKASLLKNVTDLQSAMTNLESSDLRFLLFASKPFYYEWFDSREEPPGLDVPRKEHKVTSAFVGGVRVSLGADAPGFMSPSTAPSVAIREKLKDYEERVERLISLNLSFEGRKSAETKAVDNEALSSGLFSVGNVLRSGEQELITFWHMFEQDKQVPLVTYPRSYNLQTDEERFAKVAKYQEQLAFVPSVTAARLILKQIAFTLFDDLATEQEMNSMFNDIDTSDVLNIKPDLLFKAYEATLIDGETAAKCLGFLDPKIVEKARAEQLEKVEATLKAQGSQMNGNRVTGLPVADPKEPRGEGKALDKGQEQ